MTEVGTLHREDTGALATIKVVDPLGVGDVEIDPDLPLGFANAIEDWLRDEHGYDYSDVVARSAGARAEARKKLEMLGVEMPKPRPRVRLMIQADTSAYEAELQRARQIISEMPDLPEDPPGVARVEKPAWTPPPQMVERYASPERRGDGIPVLAEAHDQSLRGPKEFRAPEQINYEIPGVTIENFSPAPDENMPGREADADTAKVEGRRMSWSEEWAAFWADVKEVWHDPTLWWRWRGRGS